MKKLLMSIAVIGLVGGFTPVFAEDDHDHDHDHEHEERVDHYEGEDIKTPEEAKKTLDEKNAEIAKILKADKLSAENKAMWLKTLPPSLKDVEAKPSSGAVDQATDEGPSPATEGEGHSPVGVALGAGVQPEGAA